MSLQPLRRPIAAAVSVTERLYAALLSRPSIPDLHGTVDPHLYSGRSGCLATLSCRSSPRRVIFRLRIGESAMQTLGSLDEGIYDAGSLSHDLDTRQPYWTSPIQRGYRSCTK